MDAFFFSQVAIRWDTPTFMSDVILPEFHTATICNKTKENMFYYQGSLISTAIPSTSTSNIVE